MPAVGATPKETVRASRLAADIAKIYGVTPAPQRTDEVADAVLAEYLPELSLALELADAVICQDRDGLDRSAFILEKARQLANS